MLEASIYIAAGQILLLLFATGYPFFYRQMSLSGDITHYSTRSLIFLVDLSNTGRHSPARSIACIFKILPIITPCGNVFSQERDRQLLKYLQTFPLNRIHSIMNGKIYERIICEDPILISFCLQTRLELNY